MKLSPSTRRLERPVLLLALMCAGLRVKLHLTPEERRRQMELRPTAPPAIAGEEEMRKERK